MNMRHITTAAAAIAVLVAVYAVTRDRMAATPATAGKAQIEAVVAQYLKDNPKAVVDALNTYHEQQKQEQQANTKKAISKFISAMADHPSMPKIGNPKGDVTIVEFFDYQCGYCKGVQPSLQTLLKEDSKVRIVLAEFPILGPASTVATRASLAVWQNWPGQYESFHDTLMSIRGTPDKHTILGTAVELGIDPAKLTAAMDDPRVAETIKAVRQAALDIGVNGTPAFLIGDNLIPGAIELADFRDLIASYRSQS